MRRAPALVAVVGVLAVAGPAGRWAMGAAGAAGDDGWTALRFVDPAVAVVGVPAHHGAEVDFVIENHTDDWNHYSWTIGVQVGGAVIAIDHGTTDVDAGHQAMANVALPADVLIGGARVVVRLDRGQQIDMPVLPAVLQTVDARSVAGGS